MSDSQFIEGVTRTPSYLAEGDVISDPAGQRAVEIRELHPIMIQYHGEMIPVWYLRGEDTQPHLKNRKIKMVLLPRTPVQVILRRGGVVTPAG